MVDSTFKQMTTKLKSYKIIFTLRIPIPKYS